MTKYEDVKHISTEEYFEGNKFSIDAFNKKYRIDENESYISAIWRVCKEISSVENTEELKKYWSERWFDEIYNNWWHPAGSIMQGAGSGRNISLANCTTISMGTNREDEEWDNLESILRNTGYTVAKTAAYRQGLGVDFSRLRPRNSAVMNSANESEGAVHWMGYIDSIGYKVGQKGRIPAMLFSLNIAHPDIEEFIGVKKDYTQIQNANISVQITDDFYEAVKKDGDFELKFKVPGKKAGDKIYIDGNTATAGDTYQDEKGYYKIASRDKKEEVISKMVSAKKLLNLIAENMWKNGEPGIQNIDIAKKYSNSDAVYNPDDEYDSRIVSTNACLTSGHLN
jgi:ribonucleoside-diphosphate reductase alpha chain